MKIIYFAKIKQILQIDSEIMELSEPKTISEVINDLKLKDEKYIKAFSNLEFTKCALNHNYVGFDVIVTNNDELAFFPPVTGG